MKIEKTEQKNHSKELLPQIVDRIFSVCRADPSFELKDEMEIAENKIQALTQKINKQQSLINQAEGMKKDLSNRLEVLNDENIRKQAELLESLGSE